MEPWRPSLLWDLPMLIAGSPDYRPNTSTARGACVRTPPAPRGRDHHRGLALPWGPIHTNPAHIQTTQEVCCDFKLLYHFTIL